MLAWLGVARDQNGAPDLRDRLDRLDRGIAETKKLREEIRKRGAEARWELLPAFAAISAWSAFLAFLLSHWRQ